MRIAGKRVGGLVSLAAVALGGAVVPVHAQDTPPAPAPTPAPSRTPTITYLPGVQPERFSIAPTPAPVPTAAPAPAPTASAVTPPSARTSPAPRASATPRAASSPVAQTPAAVPTPAPVALATSAPVVQPAPLTPAAPSPQVAGAPVAAPAAPSTVPAWVWMLAGAGGMALVFGAYAALRRRRERVDETGDDVDFSPPEAAAPPAPAVPLPPVPRRPTPPPTTPQPEATAPAGEPFEIVLRPAAIQVAPEIAIEFELLVGNLQSSAAENIRVQLALMSASPDQDRHIAGFHSAPLIDSAGQPFDLPPGGGGRMPVRLALPREQVHVVQVGGRPMFVPMVMVDLRWRAGISLRRFGADFMVGTAGQGSKLGPIWLDRPQVAGPFAATRYLPKPATAAA